MNIRYMAIVLCVTTWPCFSMKNDKLSKRKKVLHRFFEDYKEKKNNLPNVVDSLWSVCHTYAIQEKDKMGMAAGFFVTHLVDFDQIKNNKSYFKGVIEKVVQKRYTEVTKKIQKVGDEYKINDKIFQKKLKNIDVENVKKILLLGVELAQTGDGKLFKQMLNKILKIKTICYIWNTNDVLYGLLKKNSDWIEGEITDKVTEDLEFKDSE